MFQSNNKTTNPEAAKIALPYETWNDEQDTPLLITPHDTVDTTRLIKPTNEELKNNFSKAQLLAPIELEDVKFFIRKLKNKKTPGESGITNIMLKKLPDKFLQNLVKLYNASLSMGYFPQNFKNAIMIMIHKKIQTNMIP